MRGARSRRRAECTATGTATIAARARNATRSGGGSRGGSSGGDGRVGGQLRRVIVHLRVATSGLVHGSRLSLDCLRRSSCSALARRARRGRAIRRGTRRRALLDLDRLREGGCSRIAGAITIVRGTARAFVVCALLRHADTGATRRSALAAGRRGRRSRRQSRVSVSQSSHAGLQLLLASRLHHEQIDEHGTQTQLADQAALLGRREHQLHILASARVDQILLRAAGSRRLEHQLPVKHRNRFSLLRGQGLDNLAIELHQNVLHTAQQTKKRHSE